jgi:hypothetical protein
MIVDLLDSHNAIVYYMNFSDFFAYVIASHHVNLSKIYKHWDSFAPHCISKAEGKKAAARSGNYQDNVTTPLTHEYDDDATANDEIDVEGETVQSMDQHEDVEAANGVLPAIERVCTFFSYCMS